MTTLDDLVTLVRAPAFALSERSGDLTEGLCGLYVDDRRVLSRCVLEIDGATPSPVLHQVPAADTATFLGALPGLHVRRTRRMSGNGMAETLELTSGHEAPVEVSLTVRLAVDLAPVPAVKAGWTTEPVMPVATKGGLRFEDGDVRVDVTLAGLVVSSDWARVMSRAQSDEAGGSGVVGVRMALSPGEIRAVDLRVVATASTRAVMVPVDTVPWSTSVPESEQPRLARLLARSLADLDALRLADPEAPGDQFVGAGTPWYLTLFGRDSLWTARMLLPLGTDLARGTLRALARRRGRRTDLGAAEEPGKILHELRGEELAHGDGGVGSTGMVLPPVYYGSVDATPLWVVLLHDAWRAGMADGDVEDLIPALEEALSWIRGALDDRGFLTYLGTAGAGLANQGWKDSPTAVQFADGRIAEGPIALCEVQAYAVEALRGGADLLDAFGLPGGTGHRVAADQLVERFRREFWVEDASGRFPAIALDGTGRPVDTLTSNIGHLLGTGLLTSDEEGRVATRLLDLSSGYGLRTLVDTATGYDPLSYHCGSVWTHDTAIAVLGLARSGASPAVLHELCEGLLAAAPSFDWSLPELYGGQPAADGPPVPYPSSCRPQAWAAASAVALLTALGGM